MVSMTIGSCTSATDDVKRILLRILNSHQTSSILSEAMTCTIISTSCFTYDYVELLLYKGWLTVKQWLRILYFDLFQHKLKKVSGLHKIFLNRKTVKATSPIKRNKPGGRRK